MFPEDSLKSAHGGGEYSRKNRANRKSAGRGDAAAQEAERCVREFLNGHPGAVAAVTEWARAVVEHKVWGFHDTEDIVQATLLALVRNFRKGAFKPGNLRAYVRRIAKNMCIDNYRRLRNRGLHVSFEEAAHVPRTERSAEETERRTVLGRVLDRLNEGCRRIITLAYVHGYSGREIGGILGVSEETVRVRLFRCIKNARVVLDDFGGIDVRSA